jgi:hypothetical protein
LDFAHAVFLRIFVLGRCIKLSQTGKNASTIGQQNLEKNDCVTGILEGTFLMEMS